MSNYDETTFYPVDSDLTEPDEMADTALAASLRSQQMYIASNDSGITESRSSAGRGASRGQDRPLASLEWSAPIVREYYVSPDLERLEVDLYLRCWNLGGTAGPNLPADLRVSLGNRQKQVIVQKSSTEFSYYRLNVSLPVQGLEEGFHQFTIQVRSRKDVTVTKDEMFIKSPGFQPHSMQEHDFLGLGFKSLYNNAALGVPDEEALEVWSTFTNQTGFVGHLFDHTSTVMITESQIDPVPESSLISGSIYRLSYIQLRSYSIRPFYVIT